MLAPRPADRLPRLPLGFGGHGAGIDDDRVAQTGRAGGAADNLALEGVQAAAEGDDLETPPSPHRPNRAAIERAFEGERRRPGHHHMTGLASRPRAKDVEFAAVERDRRAASGQTATMRGDQRGAGAAAAGAR